MHKTIQVLSLSRTDTGKLSLFNEWLNALGSLI